MILKTLDIKQWRRVIPERWKTNGVGSAIGSAWYLENISRLESREGGFPKWMELRIQEDHGSWSLKVKYLREDSYSEKTLEVFRIPLDCLSACEEVPRVRGRTTTKGMEEAILRVHTGPEIVPVPESEWKIFYFLGHWVECQMGIAWVIGEN